MSAFTTRSARHTATAAEDATSQWLARRLTSAGFSVAPAPFGAPQFFPSLGQLEAGGQAIEAFPGWPPAPTPRDGVAARLAPADGTRTPPKLAGKIALLRLARAAGGGWSGAGVGDAVLDACQRRPRAIVAVTDSPLFHTRLDRADVATTPAELQAVADAAHAFLSSFAHA